MRVEILGPERRADLLELITPRPGAAAHWRWWDGGASAGALSPLAVLAYEAERPVEVLAAHCFGLLRRGRQEPAAELSSGLGAGTALTHQQRLALLHHLLAALEGRGVRWVFATPSPELPEPLLLEGGLVRAFDMVGRQLPLSMGPVRNLAKLARRLRQKLIEVSPDDAWLNAAQRLFSQRAPELDLALERSALKLAWRYREHPSRRYRFSVLRRRAGTGLDAFVVWRVLDAEPKAPVLELVDHWTRLGERRSTAWLLGEMALLGMAEEGVDAVLAHAPTGSALEQTLIASGCLLRREAVTVLVKALGAGAETWSSSQPLQLRAGDFERF